MITGRNGGKHLAGAIGLAVLLGACAGAPSRPAWVDKYGEAFPDNQKANLYGVGVSTKSLNPSMLRQKTEGRARQELAKQVETYVASFIKDFQQEHKDFMDPSSAGSQEFTAIVAKNVSEATLAGSQIVDHWTDNEGNMYALAKLPLDPQFIGEFSKKASEAIRERKAAVLEGKTNEMLKQLDEELSKKTQRQAQ